MPATHKIGRQVLELVVPQEPGIREAQEAFRQLYHAELLPALERIFDEMVPPDRVLRLDYLELDLGRVGWDLAPEGLVTALETQLRSQLQDLLDASSLDNGDSEPGFFPKQGATDVDILLYFLLMGQAPNWLVPADYKAEHSLLQILNAQDSQALTQVRRAMARPLVLRRLAWAFSAAAKTQLLACLLPAQAPTIQLLHEDLARLHAIRSLLPLSQDIFQLQLWEASLGMARQAALPAVTSFTSLLPIFLAHLLPTSIFGPAQQVELLVEAIRMAPAGTVQQLTTAAIADFAQSLPDALKSISQRQPLILDQQFPKENKEAATMKEAHPSELPSADLVQEILTPSEPPKSKAEEQDDEDSKRVEQPATPASHFNPLTEESAKSANPDTAHIIAAAPEVALPLAEFSNAEPPLDQDPPETEGANRDASSPESPNLMEANDLLPQSLDQSQGPVPQSLDQSQSPSTESQGLEPKSLDQSQRPSTESQGPEPQSLDQSKGPSSDSQGLEPETPDQSQAPLPEPKGLEPKAFDQSQGPLPEPKGLEPESLDRSQGLVPEPQAQPFPEGSPIDPQNDLPKEEGATKAVLEKPTESSEEPIPHSKEESERNQAITSEHPSAKVPEDEDLLRQEEPKSKPEALKPETHTQTSEAPAPDTQTQTVDPSEASEGDIAARFRKFRELWASNPETLMPAAQGEPLHIPWRQDKQGGFEVPHAGLVLLWPYLGPLFRSFGWLEKREFVHPEDQFRAVLILHYAATGSTEPPEEHALGMCKILAGLDPTDPVPVDLPLTEAQLHEADQMLHAVIANWPAVKATSPAGLRQVFLQRSGILRSDSQGWMLHIERGTMDILLDRLPWGYGTIRLGWQYKMIFVEW